jgi:hypothetical protein
MIELEVYACGLRREDYVLQLHNQMNLIPKVRYKVDVHHDLVYFEIDDAADVGHAQLTALFEAIGLEPRFVGQIPAEMAQ